MLLGGRIVIDFEEENDFYEFAEKLEKLGCYMSELPEDTNGYLECEYLSTILDK